MLTRPLYKELRSNKNKPYREEWCATKFCEAVGLKNPVISPAQRQNESIDQIIQLNTQTSLKIQIVEVAPKSIFSSNLRNYIQQNPVYGSLKEHISPLIKEAINLKIDKKYSDAAEIHLLVYLNGPGVLLDPELDIDLSGLQSEYAHASFQGISVIMSKPSEYGATYDLSYIHIPIKHNPLLQNSITPSVTAQPLP